MPNVNGSFRLAQCIIYIQLTMATGDILHLGIVKMTYNTFYFSFVKVMCLYKN